MESCSESLLKKRIGRLVPCLFWNKDSNEKKTLQSITDYQHQKSKNLKWFGQKWQTNMLPPYKDLCLVCNARPGSAGHFLIVHSFSVIP